LRNKGVFLGQKEDKIMHQEKTPEKWMLIIDAPRFLITGGATAPPWIGEACIGLQLSNNQLRDFGGEYFTISSTYLVQALRKQQPQSLESIQAAEKLDDEYCINECSVRIYPPAVKEFEIELPEQAKAA
jgi:hypothetical protein